LGTKTIPFLAGQRLILHPKASKGFYRCRLSCMDEVELRRIAQMTELEHRFWAKVEIVDDEDSCWPWTRGVHPEGYGIFQWTPPGETKSRASYASRVALYLVTGVLPVVACHTCDNRPCCRPKHLYDGTHQTNGADKAARGRGCGKPDQHGQNNDSAVLTDAIVVEARRRSKAGETQRAIAESLGFRQPTLAYAIQGKTWSHLDTIEAPHVRRKGGGSRLTEDDVRAIRAEALEHDLKTIAEQHGMKYHTVHAIVSRRSWAHLD
jgi:hypothetical protein